MEQLTKEQFIEWANETAKQFGFINCKFNFNKEGVTFKGEIDFENLFENAIKVPFSSRKKLIQSGAYSCDGIKQNTPSRHHVSFWLDSYEPSLNSYAAQIDKGLETIYLSCCDCLYSQLKNSLLWTTL